MRTRTKLTFIFTFATNLLFGQIFQAFHLNDTVDIKNKRATEINEELKIGNSTIKYIKRLNYKNQIISDERHDNDGNFIAKLTYTFDSLKSLKLSEIKEYVDESGNHYYNTEKYEYSNEGVLIKITTLSNNGNVSQVVLLTNNEKGQPVKVETFTESGELIISETAVYNYNENKATCDQRDSQDTIIYSGFFTLDYKKETNFLKPGFVYDDKGNLIKTPDGFNKIIYDQYENWISIKRYRKTNGADKLTQEQTRTIKYSK